MLNKFVVSAIILTTTVITGVFIYDNVYKPQQENPLIQKSMGRSDENVNNSNTSDLETNNSRQDAQRLIDLETVYTAIRLALLDNQIRLIPTTNCGTCSSRTGSDAIDGKTGWVKFEILPNKQGLSKYLQKLPKDPLNKSDIEYTFYSDGTNFELNSTLQSSKFRDKMVNDGGSNSAKLEFGTNLKLIR